jgi:hypothetical protein
MFVLDVTCLIPKFNFFNTRKRQTTEERRTARTYYGMFYAVLHEQILCMFLHLLSTILISRYIVKWCYCVSALKIRVSVLLLVREGNKKL